MDIAGVAIAVISAVAGIAGAYFAWVPVRKQLSRGRAARTPTPPGSGGTVATTYDVFIKIRFYSDLRGVSDAVFDQRVDEIVEAIRRAA